MNWCSIGFLSVLVASVTCGVAAQEEDTERDQFGATIGLSTEYTDNARKSYDDQLEERQDQISAVVFANYENQLIDFNANYAARMSNYDKDSQENRSTLEGEAALRIGKSTNWADLLISHSRRSQYNQPDDIEIDENLDERKIWSALPTLRHRFNSIDTLALEGEFSTVAYRYNFIRDSERKGARVYWSHLLASTDRIIMTLGQREVHYKNGTFDDFQSQFVTGEYTAGLRNLNYTLALGYSLNQFDDGSADYDAPTFNLTASYEFAIHRIDLLFKRELTDTSFGTGNLASVDPVPSADGVGIDQVERTEAQLSWVAEVLCARCELNVFAAYSEDNYRRLENDNEELSFGVGLNYRLTPSSSISSQFSRRDQLFQNEASVGFVRDRLELVYRYAVSSDLNFRVYYNFERRDEDAVDNIYNQNVIGLGISYEI